MFKIIDSVISIINESKSLGVKIHAKYSTPFEYFKALEYEVSHGFLKLPTLTEADFSHYDELFHILHTDFPGRDRLDYWTGYYSNRPSLKALIFKAHNYLHTAQVFGNLAQFHM